VERAANFALRAFVIPFVSILQHAGIYGDDRVQAPVVKGDARQVLQDELA